MELPAHYPLANAPWEEVLSWIDAGEPPFERVRRAAPWLETDDQVRSYCEGIREVLAKPEFARAVEGLFGPALDDIRERM